MKRGDFLSGCYLSVTGQRETNRVWQTSSIACSRSSGMCDAEGVVQSRHIAERFHEASAICGLAAAPNLDGTAPGRVRRRAPAAYFTNLTLRGEPASHQGTLLRHLEARLNLRVVFVEFACQAAVFEHQTVGVVEVNRFRPAVVDHLGDFDALLLEFLALLIQSGFAARLERKMIEGRWHAEPARDRCIVLGGNPFHAPRFHKSHQLVAP